MSGVTLHAGQWLPPEQVIRTQHTATHPSENAATLLHSRQLLNDTLLLMKLSISEQTRRYAELNTQHEQFSSSIHITYQPS